MAMDPSTVTEFTLGQKLLTISLISKNILKWLDFTSLKNCRLATKQFEFAASTEILQRDCCQSIQFFYSSAREQFLSRKIEIDQQQQSSICDLTLCLKRSVTNGNNFPCRSFKFIGSVPLSDPNFQNLLVVQGLNIESLLLEYGHAEQYDTPLSDCEKRAFYQLFQNQAPNIKHLDLGSFLINWSCDEKFYLPCLQYFDPNLNILDIKNWRESTAFKILEGAPNLKIVEPFCLKFTDMLVASGKFNCVKECLVEVDGGAATCWDNDPDSSAYEAFHGTKNEDFNNFVNCLENSRVQLKRFRIWVSHWALTEDNEDLLQQAYGEWTTDVTRRLFEHQKYFLEELGDIPLAFLAGHLKINLPQFPNVKFLSIRELPNLENSLGQKQVVDLQNIFPKLKSVRFVQMAEQDPENEINLPVLGSVNHLEIRYGRRGDSGSGIKRKKMLQMFLPNLRKLTLKNVYDLSLTLRDIYETFPLLEELCFDYVGLSNDFENLDPVLTGFSKDVCQILFSPENGQVQIDKLERGRSILCLKKLKKLTMGLWFNFREDEVEEDEKWVPFSKLSIEHAFKLLPEFKIILHYNDSRLIPKLGSITADVELIFHKEKFPKLLGAKQFWKPT